VASAAQIAGRFGPAARTSAIPATEALSGRGVGGTDKVIRVRVPVHVGMCTRILAHAESCPVMDQLTIVAQRSFRVHGNLKLRILHEDQAGRIFRGRFTVRHHGRHRMTLEIHAITSERIARSRQLLAGCKRKLIRCIHADHAWDGAGLLGVNAHDARMRMRTENQPSM